MSDRKCTPIRSERSGAERALARARLARFVAQLFAEPDERGRALLGDPAIRTELRDAACILDQSAATIDELLSRLPRLARLSEEYYALLGHTARARCPPYELEYARGEVFQQSQSLADVAGFYAAFGFEAGGPLHERADHVVAEWEFLAALALKEALAASGGDAEGVDCCRAAQRTFLRDHAGAWMFAFFERLRRAGPDGFFAGVAGLAEGLLREWCLARDVETGPRWIELRPVTDEDSTITCGAPGAASVELGPRLAAALKDA